MELETATAIAGTLNEFYNNNSKIPKRAVKALDQMSVQAEWGDLEQIKINFPKLPNVIRSTIEKKTMKQTIEINIMKHGNHKKDKVDNLKDRIADEASGILIPYCDNISQEKIAIAKQKISNTLYYQRHNGKYNIFVNLSKRRKKTTYIHYFTSKCSKAPQVDNQFL